MCLAFAATLIEALKCTRATQSALRSDKLCSELYLQMGSIVFLFGKLGYPLSPAWLHEKIFCIKSSCIPPHVLLTRRPNWSETVEWLTQLGADVVTTEEKLVECLSE